MQDHNIETRLFSLHRSSNVIWFRFGIKGPGLCFKNTSTLFSERNMSKKYLSLGFGWRVIYLKSIED